MISLFSISPSIYLSIYLSIHPSIYLFIYLSIFLSIYLWLRIWLSLMGPKNVFYSWLSPLRRWGCLTITYTGKFLCIYIYNIYIYIYIHIIFFCLYVCIYIYIFIYMYIYIYIYICMHTIHSDVKMSIDKSKMLVKAFYILLFWFLDHLKCGSKRIVTGMMTNCLVLVG